MTTSTLNFGWDFQNEPEVHHRQCFHPPPPGRNGSESGRRLRLPLARLVHIDARAMCAVGRLRMKVEAEVCFSFRGWSINQNFEARIYQYREIF